MEAEPNVVASKKGALMNDVLKEEPALDVGTLRQAIQ